MVGALISEFLPYIIGALGIIGTALGIYTKGRKDQKDKAKLRKAEADEKTHTRINKVTPPDPVDRKSVTSGLRRHADK